jgi:hypothetical protein
MATETTKTEQTETSTADAPEDKRPSDATLTKEGAPEKEAASGTGKEAAAADTVSDDAVFDDAVADDVVAGDAVAEDSAAEDSAAEAGEESDDTIDRADDAGVTSTKRGGVVTAGATAIVSAALGLCSLTGTSASEMMRDRKQLIGQITSQSQGQTGGGSPSSQIDALYGAPWHATALANSVFAILAVIIGGVVLSVVSKRVGNGSWVKAVALGGLILGVIGLILSGGMYLDLIASAPKIPGAPS